MRVVLKHGIDAKKAAVFVDFLERRDIYYRFLDNTPSLEFILNCESSTLEQFQREPYVNLIASITKDENQRYFTNRQYRNSKPIEVGGISFGGDNIPMIAGPCSIESEAHIEKMAAELSKLGIQILRGGAFKPRSSTYDFQGLGTCGLYYLSKAAKKYGMLSISELMDVSEIDAFDDIDIIQIGARNMQNYSLLKLLGSINKPILLKRGLAATYHEFLNAAEYIAARGNEQIILCERGIRTFEYHTRNTLDVSAVAIIKDLSHLPIIVDPSHAIGRREFVPSLAYAAIAAGADGLMIEAHTHPELSVSDAGQTISLNTLCQVMQKGRQIARVFDKTLGQI